jgi:hypothetical protein
MSEAEETLSLYSNKYNTTMALGATPIGSADRATDDSKTRLLWRSKNSTSSSVVNTR